MGDRILLWLDTWIGDLPLAFQFPDLFCFASDQQAAVWNYMARVDSQVVCGHCLEEILPASACFIEWGFLCCIFIGPPFALLEEIE